MSRPTRPLFSRLAAAALLAGPALADTCVPGPFGVTEVCLGWSGAADPVQGLDFTVTFDAAGVPAIWLRTGDPGWRIAHTNVISGAPADIRSIGLRPVTVDEDFGVSLGTIASPGAHDVGALALSAAASLLPGRWRGWSSLVGGRITGDLDKGLILVSDATATGGDVVGDFRIEGNLSGKVSMTRVEGASFEVFGKSDAKIVIGSLRSAHFTIGGDFGGSFTVEKEVVGSNVDFGGDVNPGASIDLNELDGQTLGDNFVHLNQGGEPGQKSFAGRLDLRAGLPHGNFLTILGDRTAQSVIDLHGGDVGGFLEASGGGAGVLVNGGVIRSSGHVWAAAWPTVVFSGHWTFAGMEQFSALETETSQNAGTFHITGDMDGQMWARVSELLETGVFRVDGDVGPGGSILTSSWSQLQRPGDMKGRVEIGGDVNGWMEFAGSLTKGAVVDVGGSLNGPLTIGNETHEESVIALGGLGLGGSVEIASSNSFCSTPWSANGALLVGDFASPLLQPVAFDGCVRVRSCALGVGGDLNGKLKVRGCHATPDDLNVCIDGAVNGGVSIEQQGCPVQVTWSCAGCP